MRQGSEIQFGALHTMSSNDESFSFYLYEPSHVLPALFAALVGISMLLHVYQNL